MVNISQMYHCTRSLVSQFSRVSNTKLNYRGPLVASLALVLCACSTLTPGLSKKGDTNAFLSMDAATQQQPLKRKYFSVKIPMHDGTQLAATIYQPELKAGQSAPLILHSHGFAMYRMRNPRSFYSLWMFAGQTALAAWKEGYWVISYDQRGHGDSEGIINLMSPEHEVRDVSTIIDWAIEHLPGLAFEDARPVDHSPSIPLPPIQKNFQPKLIQASNADHQQRPGLQHTAIPLTSNQNHQTSEKRDPLVGMIGESYTGSAQLIAATFDKRIDALVPMTTWYDLNQGLVPGQVAKSGWLTTLIVSGNTLNPGSMNPQINQAYQEVRRGVVSQSFVKQLEERSFSHFCHSNMQPGADALIMQSFRDSLFNFNQGVAIQQCLEAAGHDVRLIGTRSGHLLPLTQTNGLKTIYSFDRKVNCDNRQMSTKQMVLDWFDEKLKDKAGRADYIPPLCVTLNGNKGVNMDSFPVGGQSFWVDPVKVGSGMAGFWELALKPTDFLISSLLPRSERFNAKDFKTSGGTFRPAFVPLAAGSENTYIAGIPTIDFTLKSNNRDGSEPTLFVGLGIKKSDSPRIKLINDQVTPLSGEGRHQQSLTAVSTTLEDDELIGLVVYSYSNQYRFSGSGFGTRAILEGQVDIPMHSSRPLLLTDIGQVKSKNNSH